MTSLLTTIIGILLILVTALLLAPAAVEQTVVVNRYQPIIVPVPVAPIEANITRGYAL